MKVYKRVHGYGIMRSIVFDAEQTETGDWVVTDASGQRFDVPAAAFDRAFAIADSANEQIKS